MAEVDPARAPRPVLAAAALVGVEGVALLVLAVVNVVLTGAVATPAACRSRSVGGAAAGVFGGGAAAAGPGAAGAQPPARSPVVAVQLVALPVGWTLASTNGRPGSACRCSCWRVAVLVLLFATAEARDALARDH